MTEEAKMQAAFALFDKANSEDPNTETYKGNTYPKELLYSQRMSEQLLAFAPEASLALKLTARCQHIQRWKIPRDTYEKNKVGYLKWRQDLKNFHADTASDLLKEAGYDHNTIEEVRFLLLKKQLKKNAETQTLEDLICLVFLTYYLDSFSKKTNEAKMIDILQKTWKKMSDKGREAALKIPFNEQASTLIKKAITV